MRYEFRTQREALIGVLQHLSGDRELICYDPEDPDRCEWSLRLDPTDAESLADLLGLSQLAQSLGEVREAVGGLVIEWISITEDSPYQARTIGDTQLRTRTSVSVIASIHRGIPVPSPGPNQLLLPGDTVIVIGTLEGVKRAERVFEEG